MISVIVPIYNEEESLIAKKEYYQALSEKTELIFMDGQSTDKSCSLAQNYGMVFSSDKGRAHQMNAGAREAKGDVVLFLHADTQVSIEAVLSLSEKMEQHHLIGGCFSQVLEQKGWLYKWIAFTGNMRAKLSGIFYGDQGIFVLREIFLKMGGFPEIAVGEDILFTKRLRKAGKVKIFPQPIYCSTRRWHRQGVLKTYLLNQWIALGMLFKVDSRRLAHHYHDIR